MSEQADRSRTKEYGVERLMYKGIDSFILEQTYDKLSRFLTINKKRCSNQGKLRSGEEKENGRPQSSKQKQKLPLLQFFQMGLGLRVIN